MARFTPGDYQNVRDLVERQTNAAAAAAATATPQQATNIVDDSAKYPYLSPQVITLLNQANASQATKDVANYAVTHQALQQGKIPEPDSVSTTNGAGKKKGWFDRLTDLTSYLTPGGKQLSEKVDSKIAGGWSWAENNGFLNKFTGAIKASTRLATTALASPYQAVQNYVGQNIDEGMGALRAAKAGNFGQAASLLGHEALGTVNGGDATRPNGGVIGDINATDAASMAQNWSNQGSGFFAGADVQKATALKAQQTRGVDPGGHAWTIGRFVTTGLPQDSFLHRAVSGTVDMASALSLDPVQIHGAVTADLEHLGAFGQRAMGPVGSQIIKARLAEQAVKEGAFSEAVRGSNYAAKAAETFGGLAHEAAQAGDFAAVAEHSLNATSWAQHASTLADEATHWSGITDALERAKAANPEYVKALENQAGLVNSAKGQTALLPNTFKWFLSESGQQTVEALREAKTPLDVSAMYGGKISVHDAYQLAKADTNEGVIAALGDALTNSTDRLRAPNLIASPKGLAMSKNVQDRFPDLARALGKVPNSTLISPQFPEESVQNMFDVLGNIGVTGEKRRTLVNGLMEAFATGDPAAYYQTAKNTSKLVEDTLVEAGAHPEDAARMTRYIKDEEAIKAYTSFDHAAHMPYAYIDGQDSPLRYTQMMQGSWSLMDPDKLLEARQWTSSTKALLGVDTKRRAAVSALDWYQTRLFKPAAILRPALASRLLPDEALRVLFGGHVGSSGSALMAMMNAPKTDMLSRVFDEGQRFGELDKAIAKADKQTAVGNKLIQSLRDGISADDAAKMVPKTAADEVRSLVNERQQILSNGDLSLDELFGGAGDRLTEIDQAIAKAAGVDDDKLSRMIAERENILRAHSGAAGEHVIEGIKVGHGNATIASRLDGRINDSILYKTGSHIILDTADKRYTNLIPKAMAEELTSMSADPVYRRIAVGGLLPGDRLPADAGEIARLGLASPADAVREPGVYWHGTSSRFAGDTPSDIVNGRSSANLFGPGLYTTDSPRTAFSYTRKGATADSERAAYAFKWTGSETPKILDLEAPASDAFREAIRSQLGSADHFDVTEEAYSKVEALLSDGQSSGADIYSAFKSMWAGSGIPRYEVDDMLHSVAEHIQNAGFDGMRYDGGARIGGTGAHEATIWFDPSKLEKTTPKFSPASIGEFAGTKAHDAKLPTTLDDVEQWLLNGDGRKYLDAKALEMSGKGVEITPEQLVHDWVQSQAADIEEHWGQNQEARRAIATGQLRGEALRAPKQWGPRMPPSDQTMQAMREIIDAGDAPAKIRYSPTIEEARRHGLTQAMRYNDAHNMITDWAFNAFYGLWSDKFIRIPEYANSYWANAEKMISKLSPEEGQQLIRNLDMAGGLHGDAEGWLGKLKDTLTSDAQEKRIRTLAAAASGDQKLEDMDKLAHGYALDDVKRLMFDMDRKNQFQDMSRLLFPFGRAWWEVISTWAKIGLGEGHEPLLGVGAGKLDSALSATKALGRAGENVAGIAHVADRDIRAFRGNGWFYRDENGQEVFNYPASGLLGAAMSKMTGTPGIDTFFRGKVSGLSIGLQVTPGLGPVFSIPTYALMQKSPAPSALVDMVFPFGEPKSWSDAVMPSWFSKMKAGIMGDEKDPIYANTFMEVTRALSNSGKYGTDQASIDKLLDDAHKQAAALTVLRGLTQAAVPSAPIATYIAKTKQGDMTTVLLAKKLAELRANPDLVKKLGYTNANEAFIGTYGPQTMAYLVAKTKTLSGGETASSQFGRWEQSNGDLVSHYKNIYGFFGPQAPGYDAAVVQRQINMGNRKQNTPNDVLALANAKAADMIYYALKDSIEKKNTTLGVKDLTDDQRTWLAAKRDMLAKEFPGWDTVARGEESLAMRTKQFTQLAAAVTDRKVLATPTGQSLAKYWADRDKVIAEAQRRGVRGWQQANATEDLRQWLAGRAKKLAQNDLGFASMNDYLLSSETKG